MKFFYLTWSNLKRKKFRTLLTLLSIVVAFVLFGFLSAIKQALTGGVTIAGANRLIVRHKVSIIQLLPVSYQARMARIPGVSLVTIPIIPIRMPSRSITSDPGRNGCSLAARTTLPPSQVSLDPAHTCPSTGPAGWAPP